MTSFFPGTDAFHKQVQGGLPSEVVFTYHAWSKYQKRCLITLIGLGVIAGSIGFSLGGMNMIGERAALMLTCAGYGTAASVFLGACLLTLDYIRCLSLNLQNKQLSSANFIKREKYVDVDQTGFCKKHGFVNQGTNITGLFHREGLEIHGVRSRVPLTNGAQYRVAFCRTEEIKKEVAEEIREKYAYGPPRVNNAYLEMRFQGLRELRDDMGEMLAISIRCHSLTNKQRYSAITLVATGILIGSLGLASLSGANALGTRASWIALGAGYGIAGASALGVFLFHLNYIRRMSLFYSAKVEGLEAQRFDRPNQFAYLSTYDAIERANFATQGYKNHAGNDGILQIENKGIYGIRYDASLTHEEAGYRVEFHRTRAVHDERVAQLRALWCPA